MTVAEYAGKLITGQAKDPSGVGDQGYHCQQFARSVVDAALGISVRDKYGPIPNAPGQSYPTAHTAEIAFTKAGLSVNGPVLPGDQLFQEYKDSNGTPGHTGIAVRGQDGGMYVLENTTANRGVQALGLHTRLTPIAQWGRIRTIIRFPEDVKNPADKGVDVGKVGGAVDPVTGVVNPAPAASTVPGIAAVIGDLALLINPPAGPDSSHKDPLWLYNTLTAYEGTQPTAKLTNLGAGVANGALVIIRKPFATEMETAMPILGPISIAVQAWQERWKQIWTKLRSYYLQSEAWGRTYQPIYNLGDTTSGQYRWPLPFVTQVSCRQDAGTGAVAEVELQVSDPVEAEMILSTLTMIQRYKNAIVEIWRPVFIHDEQGGGERQVVVPAMTGVVDEVTSSPYPHTIKLRVLPQDQVANLRGINPDEMKRTTFPAGTKLYEIIQAIGDQYKYLFFTPSALRLGDLPSLQRTVGDSGYDLMGRAPLDVVRELVERSGGLQMTPLFGTEVLGRGLPLLFVPRAVFMIYEPSAFGPFTPGFFQNELWSHLLSPIANLLGRGQDAVGEVAVFYPQDLGRDHTYLKNMAGILDTYASDTPRHNAFGIFLDTMLSVASVFGVGNGPAVRAGLDGQTQDALVTLLDNWWPDGSGARVQKYYAPVTGIEEFSARTPSSTDLANPVFGSDGGNGTQRAVRVSAERAAKLMQVTQSPDGSFQLNTPTGGQTFDKHDSVTLYYASSYGKPTMVTPVTGGQQVDDNPGKFFPFILTLQVQPSHGVRIGMPAAVIGLGRIDGMWEVQSIQWSLGRSDEQTVTLRAMRDILIV